MLPSDFWLIRDRERLVAVVEVVVVGVAVVAVEDPGVVGVVPTGRPEVRAVGLILSSYLARSCK